MPEFKCRECGSTFKSMDIALMLPVCPRCKNLKKQTKLLEEQNKLAKESNKGQVSTSDSSSSGSASILYWLLIGWWLYPIQLFIQKFIPWYIRKFREDPKRTGIITGVVVLFIVFIQITNYFNYRNEITSIREDITIPQSQKDFVQHLDKVNNDIFDADLNLRKSIAQTRITDILKSTNKGMVIANWRSIVKSTEGTSSGGNLGFVLVIPGTKIKLTNYKYSPKDSDPLIIKKESSFFKVLTSKNERYVRISGKILFNDFFDIGMDEITLGFLISDIKTENEK